MKIAFECRDITVGCSGGIALFWQGIIQNLIDHHPEHEYFIFYCNHHKPIIKKQAPHVHYYYLGHEIFFEQVGRICSSFDINVMIRTFPNDGKNFFPEDRQIVEIPDMQHEYFTNFFDADVLRLRRLNFNYCCSKLSILTLSQTSKNSILQHPWTEKNDIHIVSPVLQEEHLYVQPELTVTEEALIPTKSYFYYPANLWPHKNHKFLLAGFKKFLSKTHKDYELVLTGDSHGWDEFQKDLQDLPVKHLGFVSKPLVAYLLRNAVAMTFFSLYEGFGMPLLEAFAADTPVICSNVTSLPEVGQDAVLMCDPWNIDAIAELMSKITSDAQLRNTLIQNGRKQLQNYTWEKSVNHLLSACEQIDKKAMEEKTQIIHEHQSPLITILTDPMRQSTLSHYTVESISAQTYQNIEHLTLDKVNQSKGEICVYLRSGDVLLPDALAKIVNHFRQYPECDMVYNDTSSIFWRKRVMHLTDVLEDIIGLKAPEKIDSLGGNVQFLPGRLMFSRSYTELLIAGKY